MITEQDLREAIAECEGQRDPDSRTCIKLAAFYIIKDHLFPSEEAEQLTKQPVSSQIGDSGFEKPSAYSYAPSPEQIETTIDYYSDSDFGRAVEGRQASEVWPLIDELVTSIQVVMPRIYESFMRRLQ